MFTYYRTLNRLIHIAALQTALILVKDLEWFAIVHWDPVL